MQILEKKLNISAKIGKQEMYEESNNNSARRGIGELRNQLKGWLAEGKVEELKRKPRIINPLSMVEQYDMRQKKTKHRVVIDQSRFVNKRIETGHTKLEDLSVIEPAVEKEMYMTSFDLVSMYHQIELTNETKELFCFQLEDEEGITRFYRWNCLTFGNCKAVEITKDILKPVISYFRNLGIVIFIYIDDGLLLNKSMEMLKVETDFVIKVIEMLGWEINYKKSELEPRQSLLVQGMILDTEEMKYFYPEWKQERLIGQINELLKKGEVYKVEAKELASVYGRIATAAKAFGKIVSLTRHGQHRLGLAVLDNGRREEPNWNCSLYMDTQTLEEMKIVLEFIKEGSGYRIQNGSNGYRIEARGLEIETSEMPELHEERKYRVMVSDASEKVAFAYEAEKFQIVEEYGFNEEEIAMGSGQRELRAVIRTLEARENDFMQGPGKVYWITDSKNAHSFLKKGSRAQHIQKDVLQVRKLEKRLGIRVEPIWKPRTFELLAMADLGSKMYLSTDEWTIDDKTYQYIVQRIGMQPTLDGFATSENAKTKRFFSKYPQIGSIGLDFFAQELDEEEIYWLCPPVKDMIKVMKKVRETEKKVKALVSFPEWKSACFWPFIVRHNSYHKDIQQIVMTKPIYRTLNKSSNVFVGKKQFKFITIYVNGETRKKALKYNF